MTDTSSYSEFIPSTDNRIITQSVKIRPGTYILDDPDGNGALRIEADDIVVDFQGAVITSRQNVEAAARENLDGIGLSIEGLRGVTIKNAVIRGYRCNIWMETCRGITLENCDTSISRAERVFKDGMPIDVWLEIRDMGHWREYGAGIWIEKSTQCTVRRCRSLYSNIGIVLAFSNKCVITESDFSFNSAWGIALWQSCENIVSWCLADFVNRPWRSGYGADSAAMAVSYESHRNYIVGVSMTHGGDGFFLTNLTDVGYNLEARRFLPYGSSDDNIIAYCDGSWSPANAFEGTFSFRNVYFRNIADYSGHGFWLGFSNDSLLLENEISHNHGMGIAIEHGSGTRIEKNTIEHNNDAAIALWASPGEERECHPSRNIEIRDNTIRHCKTAFNLTNSTDIYINGNIIEDTPITDEIKNTKTPDSPSALEKFVTSPQYLKLQEIFTAKPAGFRLYRELGMPLGMKWLEMTDYHPRDFRNSLAAYRLDGWSGLELYVMNPGDTKIEIPEWAELEPNPNDRHITKIKPKPEASSTIRYLTVKLQQADRTEEITVPILAAEWTELWYNWDKDKNPITEPDAEDRIFSGRPDLERKSHIQPGWDWMRGPVIAGTPESAFALEASTEVNLPAGTYKFSAGFTGSLSIWIDSELVCSDWTGKRYSFVSGNVEIAEGTQKIKLRHCQDREWKMLRLYWAKIR
jgi:parallel beta-helix repeat protein